MRALDIASGNTAYTNGRPMYMPAISVSRRVCIVREKWGDTMKVLS